MPLYIPAAQTHQAVILSDPSRRKLWRAGRRTGKSRAALIAATVGHGPKDAHLPGIVDGASGVWVQRDFPNLRAIWREELEPRFTGLTGVEVNQSEHRISITGRGRLELRSAENIDSCRGGAYDFAICDEAAYFHLEYALNSVILPPLLDREGWLLVISSPNAGHDGNPDKVTPSYFNRLCGEIMSGARPDWRQWHNRTEDNPTLPAGAIAALRRDYAPGSLTARQELDAELLVGGAGFALPHLDAATMLVEPFPIPASWFRFGSFDWGYNHPWSFGAWAVDADGVTYRTHSVSGRQQTPTQIGEAVERAVSIAHLTYIVAGSDLWNQDRSKGIEVPPVAQQLGARGWRLVPVKQEGRRPRAQRLDTFRRYCGWPAVDGLPGEPGKLKLFATPANRAVLASWAQMLLDPNDPETPLKVDADQNGKGGDDAYDEASYALASQRVASKEAGMSVPQDRSMGWDMKTQRPRERPDPEEEFDRMLRRGAYRVQRLV